MLLATDLDGTFLAGDEASRHNLYRLISQHPNIELVYVTGRGLESVIPLISDPLIPTPKFIICDVGATIVHGDTLAPFQPIQADIDSAWVGEYAVEAAVRDVANLERQDVPQERRCSFFCSADDVTESLHQIAQDLGCDLLFSASKYLDFLPCGVNKGSSLLALINNLNIPKTSVLVAGDTLNDLSMYQHGFLGVCVGASEQKLLEETKQIPTVFHSAEPGCGGILEALSYFNFLGTLAIENEVCDTQIKGDADLVILYHRLPHEEYINDDGYLERRQPRSPNGIIPTLLSFFADGQAGSWVAWSTFDEHTPGFRARHPLDTDLYPNLTVRNLPLSKETVDIFYKKFSKEAFWPTLHTFWEKARFDQDHWLVYKEVNELFAQAAAQETAEGGTVWIHDYNLWLVPAFLRELRPDVKIAFFHHTYFPSADVFNVLPWRKEIISSLLQCNLIGFHIPRQSENFLDVAMGVAPVEVLEKEKCAPRFMSFGCAVGVEEMATCIKFHNREIALCALPVGLDVNRIRKAFDHPTFKKTQEEIGLRALESKIILSIERLDYTKGILQKLHAFEALLEQNESLCGHVELILVCVPAAREMTIYEALQRDIERAVGRINGKFTKVDWVPVKYFFRGFPFEALAAFYELSDIMWITPLRDGLNLVAKEFVAAKGLLKKPGVLILSEFAGAAAELKGALLTNPHDPVDLLETCVQALNMRAEEIESRLSDLFDIVRYQDIKQWGHAFLEQVARAK